MLADQLFTVLTLVEGDSIDILVTRGHVSEAERRSLPLRRRGYVAPKLGPVSNAREDRDDLLDVGGFGHWKGPTSKGMEKNPTGKGERSRKGRYEVFRTIENAKDSRSVLELRENRSSIGGLLGKATAATEPRTSKFFWKGKRRARQVWQRWTERQIQRCWSTCLESAD